MWDKYGNFDSAEEINEAAGKLKAEGKEEEVKELAKGNGIDEELAELFLSGELPFLCDDLIAAIGKLDTEIKHYPKDYRAIAQCQVHYLKAYVEKEEIRLINKNHGLDIDITTTGEELAKAIRKKKNVLNDLAHKMARKANGIALGGDWVTEMDQLAMMVSLYLYGEIKQKGKEDGSNSK